MPWLRQSFPLLALGLLACGAAPLVAQGSQGPRGVGDGSAVEQAQEGPSTVASTEASAGSGASQDSATESDTEEGDDDADDEGGEEPAEDQGEIAAKPRPHPLDGWSRSQLDRALVDTPTSLGSASIGYTNAGALFNGVQMPAGDAWTLVDPAHAWGTEETVTALARCLNLVRSRFPETPKIPIGHISGSKGGYLSPHRSHQAGRDVDVSYYYLGETRWYARATAANLDRARTWAFVRALVTESDIDMILIDRSLQRLLRDYAIGIGENREWVDGIFNGAPGLRPLVRHAKGHATHIHVRFFNPVAQETGRRVHELLVQHRMLAPTVSYATYVAKKGDTLGHIAKKFGTTTKALQKTNGLRTTLIRAGTEYKILRTGGVRPAAGPVLIPPRRMPPEPAKPASAYPRPPEATSRGNDERTEPHTPDCTERTPGIGPSNHS